MNSFYELPPVANQRAIRLRSAYFAALNAPLPAIGKLDLAATSLTLGDPRRALGATSQALGSAHENSLSLALGSAHLGGEFSTELEKIDGRGQSPGSQRTQFKPGAEWTGNRGGRPRIVKEKTAAWLEECDNSGKTNARRMVEAIGNKAIAGGRDSVAAFRELRQTVEPAAAENKRGTLDVGHLNLDLLKFISEANLERAT